jgi:trehalose 6-phosphate synthase
VHDYQLQLVPAMVRAIRPDVRIGWFNHIPFPPVELFAQLPWRRALLEGLLGADFLGFQRTADAENFLRCRRRLLGMATKADTVTFTSSRDDPSAQRTVRAAAIPISVDFRGLDELARTPEVVARAAEIHVSLGDPKILVLGVDRLDYTKGTRHRLKAYEELLQDKAIAPPEVMLMQVATPSREFVDAYRHLREEVEGTVGRINGEFSALGQPAMHYLHHTYPRTEMAALFLAADVLLVTPLRDGMNLIAKEYVSCRHDLGGALVLSEFTGAWDELHEAFICNPHDIEGVTQTIMRAITAPEDERRRRMKARRARGRTAASRPRRRGPVGRCRTLLGCRRTRRARHRERSTARPRPCRRRRGTRSGCSGGRRSHRRASWSGRTGPYRRRCPCAPR